MHFKITISNYPQTKRQRLVELHLCSYNHNENTYSEIGDSQGHDVVIGEDLERVVGEDAEDDEDVADHGDGDEAAQDEDGDNSLPGIFSIRMINYSRFLSSPGHQ